MIRTLNTHSSSPVFRNSSFLWAEFDLWAVPGCVLLLLPHFPSSRCACRQAGCSLHRLDCVQLLSALPTQQTQSRRFQSVSSWQTSRRITTHTILICVSTHRDTAAECFTVSACHLDFGLDKIRQTVAVWSKQFYVRSTERQWSEPVAFCFKEKDTLMCFLLSF